MSRLGRNIFQDISDSQLKCILEGAENGKCMRAGCAAAEFLKTIKSFL